MQNSKKSKDKKTNNQKTSEVAKLHKRIAELEASETERKRAVEALHSDHEHLKISEMLHRTLVDNMDLGVSFIDADHTILMASAAKGKQFNIPTMSDCIGKKCFRAYERRETVCPHCPGVQVMATGQPAEVETEGIRTDGSRYCVRLQAFPVFGDDGTVTGFIEISENIIERKKAEKALKDSEERFHAIFETAQDLIFLKDCDLKYTAINPAMERYFDVSASELIGKTSATLLGKEVSKQIKEEDLRVLGGEVIDAEHSFTVKGNTVIQNVIKVPIRNSAGEIIALCGIARDITERKQAEEELYEAADQYRILTDTSMDGFIKLDLDGRIVDVNKAYSHMLGYSNEELCKMTVADIEARETPDEIKEKANKLMEVGVGRFESRHRRKDGDIIDVELSMTLLRQSGHILVFLRNITEQKKAEEALRESAEKFRIISNTTMDGFSEIDQDGHFLDVNEESCRISGYSRDEHLTMSVSDIEAAETPDETKRRLQNIIETGSDRFESRIRHKDGRLIDIEASISFFPQTGHFLNFHRDITERKRADDLMHIQHELAVALSAEQDLNEGLRLCFDAAMRVSGMDCGGIYLLDELSGALNLVFHEGLSQDFVRSVSHFEADSDNVRLVMAGKPVFNQHANLKVPMDEAERRENLLAMAVIPILYVNRVIGCLNIASHTLIDLSSSARRALESIAAQIGSAIARLQSEEAFRKSKARFRDIVDLLPQAVFEMDAEGNFLFLNASGLKSFGYTQEDIDKGLSALQLTMPKERKRAEENLQKVLSGEKSIGNEYTIRRKDGSTFPAILYASPIIHEGGPAGLRGIAIDITERKRFIEERFSNLERLRRSLEETIGALSSTLEARDPYTAGHQRRVSDLAVAIAEEMGLSGEQVDGIRMAGFVHDIGKVYVPSELLNKTRRLYGAEYELFKSHCQVGYDILKTIDFPWPVAPMVLQHHERQDGSGYPQGLYGGDIILEARILAVADVVEAMSGHRPYRSAYSVGDALEEILHHKDTLYDPEVVDACLRVFYDKGFAFKEEESEL